MSTKAKAPKPLSQEEINSYFHKRVARLERNNGQLVHPHPQYVTAESQAEDEQKAAADREREAKRKAAEVARTAKEAKQAAAHKEAEDTSPIIPGDDPLQGAIVPGAED